MTTEPDVMLVTADQAVRDAVESAAAALGLGVRVRDVEEASAVWLSPRVVLVGGDRAAAMASLAPSARPHVYVVGFDAVELGTWSMPLGAGVIPLPHGRAWLTGVLARDGDEDARSIAVVGGSGGVGASTLAAGLALAAARRGLQCALVDLDPLGGGLDLVMGGERSAGWRWPRLVGARGEVGDVRGVLPVVHGVAVVAMARGEAGGQLSPEAVHAVLGSLGRHHDLLVLDPGRTVSPASRQALRTTDATLLLAAGGVRAVAAAARVREEAVDAGIGLAVRTARGGPPAAVVADALRVPLWGAVPNDRALAAQAEAGEAPGLGRRSRWSRAVDRLLDTVLEEVRGER